MKRLIVLSIVYIFAICPTFANTVSNHMICSHDNSTIKISGLDLDELKCELSTTQQALGSLAVVNVKLQSEISMLRNDLAIEKANKNKPISEHKRIPK